MSGQDVMDMCERGKCRVIYGEFLLMRTNEGVCYLSLDGVEWIETTEDLFVRQFQN